MYERSQLETQVLQKMEVRRIHMYQGLKSMVDRFCLLKDVEVLALKILSSTSI